MRYSLVALFMLVSAATTGQAAELVMFRQALCEWCEVWDEEVGVVYNKTDEGKQAPIRMVDIFEERPADLKDIKSVIFTPTFVLIENDTEVGRILGYPGEAFFWGMLSQLLKKIPAEG